MIRWTTFKCVSFVQNSVIVIIVGQQLVIIPIYFQTPFGKHFFFHKLNQIINKMHSDLVSANNKPSIVRIFQVKLRRRTTKMIEQTHHTRPYNLLPPHKTIFTIKHAYARLSRQFFFKLEATLYGNEAVVGRRRRRSDGRQPPQHDDDDKVEKVCVLCAACVWHSTAI